MLKWYDRVFASRLTWKQIYLLIILFVVCYVRETKTTVTYYRIEPQHTIERYYFYSISCHHGCMVDRLKLSQQCNVCGTSYRFLEVKTSNEFLNLQPRFFCSLAFFQYGSLWDFFMRYWCQYSCAVVILLILFGSAAFAMANALGDINTFSLARFCQFSDFQTSSRSWSEDICSIQSSWSSALHFSVCVWFFCGNA